jgi:hypothetical protein
MQRKIIKFLLLTSLLLVLASELPSVSNADPIPKPAIFPMTITILSPSDGQEISGNDFLLNLSITDIPNSEIRMWVYPNNGIRSNSPPVEFNGWVWVYLDGNETNTFPEYPLSLEVIETQPTLLYSFNLTGAPEGEHTLSVKVSCASQYHIDLHGISAPTNITINAPNPSAQITQPFTADPSILQNTTIMVVSIIVIATFLLLYRKHRKLKV